MKSLRILSCAAILALGFTGVGRAADHDGRPRATAHFSGAAPRANPAQAVATQTHRGLSHTAAHDLASRNFQRTGLADRGPIHAALPTHIVQSASQNSAPRHFRSVGLAADRGHNHDVHNGGHYDRAWWDRYHRHDRVVFIGGSYLYNPYYYGGFYGPGYYRGPVYYGDDYYDSGPVYQGTVVDSSVAVDVQRRLRREGYYRGPIDGVVGPGTRGAIAAFQRDNGLTPNGRITGSLLEALGLS